VETARLQSCEICDAIFLVCDPGAFNQRYCKPACAEAAKQESRRAARRRYRRSPEGREQHRDEEQRRRDRRRSVGDQLVPPAAGDARVAIVAEAEGIAAARRVTAGLARWRVVVGAELAAVAETLRASRAVLVCASCGRRGRIVATSVRGESPWRAAERKARRQRRQRGDDGA